MHVARARLVWLAVQQTRAHRTAQQRFGQRIDQQGRDAQHDDLAEGIKPTEIDEDDVHHVGTAAALVGIRQMEFGNAVPPYRAASSNSQGKASPDPRRSR